MVPYDLATRLSWLRADALAKYRRTLDHFQALLDTASKYELAEMHIKLGEPIKGIELLRGIEPSESTTTVRKKVLLARALWTMRMPEVGAWLLFKSPEIETSYDICLELARFNYILAKAARDPQQTKKDLEAASSTLKHCMRLDPHRPEAYILHARLAAPYAEWRDLALDFYDRFVSTMPQEGDESLEWFILMDAFDTNYILGRLVEAKQWLERLQQLLNKSPWLGDRFAFQSLAHAFRLFEDKNLYEENLQCAWLLYPSKIGELVRAYTHRGKLFRVLQMFVIAYRNTDLREYRFRLRLAKASGATARQVLTDLIGIPF
jgi:tetratricopeptide (TPR) repeat protein